MTSENDTPTGADVNAHVFIGGIAKPHGKSISEKRRGPKFPDPRRVTLMALSVTPEMTLRVRTCWADIGAGQTVADVEAKLFAIASKDVSEAESALQGVYPLSANLAGIDFDKPSHFTIVVHNDDWTFCYDGQYPGYDAFGFFADKDVLIDQAVIPKRFDQNWSFFNAEPIEVAGFAAVRTQNYIKKPGTDEDLGKSETSPFGFNIFLAVPLAPIIDVPRAIIIVDPTGDNKGPG